MSTTSFRDSDFQTMLVRFLCRDRNFLKDVAPLLRVEDFKPRRGETPELFWIADVALNFWHEYGEPIGGLLRPEVIEFANKQQLQGRTREKLLELVEYVKNQNGLVAVDALKRIVVEYKAKRARQQFVQEVLDAEEKGELNQAKLLKWASKIQKNFGATYKIVDYAESIDQRLARRRIERLRKWPYLFIDAIDEKIRVLSRGTLGMCLAQYKVGKSVFLIWLAYAYSIQGYRVLYFTLEDPVEEVEDRFDSLLTRISMKSLQHTPVKTKRLFRRAKESLRGKIKIIDGTDGGMSVAMIESIWDQERNKGFAADVVIVDYDDEIEPPKSYGKEQSARRFEFADIYRELRRFASRRKLYVWTAAQAVRGKEDQKVIAGKDAAEDISKIRKVAFCVGIGRNPDYGDDGRHLYIAAHKYDQARIGFDIVGRFRAGVFYDRDATRKMTAKVLLDRQKQKGLAMTSSMATKQ